MNHKKIDPYLDFPCRELSVRGLRFAVAFFVCREINVSCASTGEAIHLYGSSLIAMEIQVDGTSNTYEPTKNLFADEPEGLRHF